MRRYKITDLCIFALLLCFLEAASAWALHFFPGEAYTFSLTLFFALLMTARWGAVGTAYAVLGGVVYCMVQGGTAVQFVVYAVGNSFFAANLLWLKFLSMKKLRASTAYTALFCITGYLLMGLGRAAVSWLMGQGFWLVRFWAVDAFGVVVTLILLFIARKQNGLFEPQHEYLLRLKQEEDERKHGA